MSARTFDNSAEAFRQADRRRASARHARCRPRPAQRTRCGGRCPTIESCATSAPCSTRRSASAQTAVSPGISRNSSSTPRRDRRPCATRRSPRPGVAASPRRIVDRDALDVANQYNRIAASIALIDGIRTPRALGWARPDRIVVLEPMRGMPVDALAGRAQPVAMRQLGVALANIHGLPTDFGRGPFQRYRPRAGAPTAPTWWRWPAPTSPTSSDRFRDQLGRRAADLRRGRLPARRRARQQRVVPRRPGPHDRLRSGRLRCCRSRHRQHAGVAADSSAPAHPDTAVDGLGAAFLDGYSTVRPLPSGAELRWYTAAALVAERAIRAVNRVNRPVLAVLPELLDMADAVLAGKLQCRWLTDRRCCSTANMRWGSDTWFARCRWPSRSANTSTSCC